MQILLNWNAWMWGAMQVVNSHSQEAMLLNLFKNLLPWILMIPCEHFCTCDSLSHTWITILLWWYMCLMILTIVVFIWIISINPSRILCCLGTNNCLSLRYFDYYFSRLVFVSNYPSFCIGFMLIIVVFVNKLCKIIWCYKGKFGA